MRKLIMIVAGACLFSTAVLAQTAPAADMPPHQLMRQDPGKMFEGLSAEGRKLVAAEMINGREKMKANQDQRKAMREKIRIAMTAEPYNAYALRDAFEEERKMSSDQQKMRHEHVVAMIGKLSASDRKIFAEASSKMEQRWGKGRGKRGARGKSGDDQSAPPSSM
jgi:uncharacterized membrane protein